MPSTPRRRDYNDREYQRDNAGHARHGSRRALLPGAGADFTSFRAGTSYLNLIAQGAERKWSWWGRVIFYHSDVDALYASVMAAGYRPDTAPRDAEWGERFFHMTDPDGHELSFAWPIR